MVAILVALTVLLCVLVDWWLERRQEREASPGVEAAVPPRKAERSPPVYVGGFQLHEELAFHRGHTWAHAEAKDLLRVGIDDFACRLLGEIDGLDLPQVGEQITQGREAWVASRGGKRAPMLSPVTGTVIAANPLVLSDLRAVRSDPYGNGWLLLVRTRDLRTNLNNLFTGELATHWMESAGARLRSRLHRGLALSFADGGSALEDLSTLIDDEQWERLVTDFFLTGR